MKYNLSKMTALDLYLSTVSDKEYDKIEHQIQSSKTNTAPLVSWDLFSQKPFPNA